MKIERDMQKDQQRIFFTAHDLWKIPDFAHLQKGGIYYRYRMMKDYFNKKLRTQHVTFIEAAEYLGISEEFLRKTVQKS